MKPKTILEYIEAAPREAREKLYQMHETIRAAAPGAIEGLKWSMPAYSYKRILVTFALFKHHIGFYPTPSGIEAFKKELSGYVSAKGSVQFPIDKQMPLDLISKIVKFRVEENLENAKTKLKKK